jgi:YVTN family beta-propeller protein
MRGKEAGGPALDIKLLGPVEVSVGTRPIALRRRQQRALVALLALHANRVVSIDELSDALWGERPPATAPVALYGLVSGLRKLLAPEEGEAIVTMPPGYLLVLEPDAIDVARFEHLAADGRRALDEGDPNRAAELLREALALWSGRALQDVELLPFARLEAERLERLRLDALEHRIEADLRRGRNGDLVPELEPLVAAHPLRERLRGQLMRALYASGRQADALAAYRDARSTLVDELGLEPSPDLQALERAILRHDPDLTPGIASTDGTSGLRSGRRSRRRMLALAALATGAGVVALAVVLATGAEGDSREQVAADGVVVIDGARPVATGRSGASMNEVASDDAGIWITSSDDKNVARVDPGTGEIRDTIPVGSGASGVAADEHAVWVANSFEGTVSRIDPRAKRVVDTISVGSAPVGVALGRGSVWVTSRDDRTLWRLDARTGSVIARIPVGAAPRAVAVDAGAVWVADEARGAVFRVDPDRKTAVDVINVGNGPSSIAVGHDAVWVANGLDGTVSRIDPERDVVTATITVGDGPRGLAVTPEGVWVSNEFGGTVVLIDPRTDRVKRTVRLGERPQGLAAVAGRIVVAFRSDSSAHRGGTLRVVASSPAPGPPIDTLTAGAAPTIVLTNDGLVAFRRVGGADSTQLVPDLAVAIPTPSDDGRTFTFRVRDGIRYSTGSLVQPGDFRRALERNFIVTRDVGYYGAIVGAEECVANAARCDLSRGIVTDEEARTVTFHLRGPDPDFLYKLALPYAFALPPGTPNRLARTKPLPATGPYMVARNIPARLLVLVRNPHFREWSKAAQPDGYPDRIEVRLLPSDRAAVRATEKGTADVAWVRIPPELEREVRTQYASQLRTNPVPGVTYLFLNTRKPPFNDVRARQAVNYAADRAAGVRVSGRGVGGDPTCQILPPDFTGFERYCPYTGERSSTGLWRAPDLERARELVAQSGTKGARVTVWVPDNHPGEGPFAASLLRSLGYRVHLKHVGVRFYPDLATGRIHPSPAEAGLFTWFADYPAASNYIATLFSCDSFNLSRFCNHRIERQIRHTLQLQTSDPYLANQGWARLDRQIVDLAPVVPLFTLKTVDLVSGRVGNYQYSMQWGVLLAQLWVR